MKRFLASLLCLTLLFASFPTVAFAEDQKEDIVINNLEEFLAFSKACSYDGYSKNKTVLLMADIDVSASDFSGIPIFCGDFNGNHHTISGVNLAPSGSNVGFFRYVTAGSTVRNLSVKGVIVPDGTEKNIGGLVANNSGRLLNVTFEGIVTGKSGVGGLVGINQKTGYIANAFVKGTISGEHATGGVVGQNYGIIIKATNESIVNTSTTDESIELKDIDMSILNTKEDGVTHSDTGGIAGYSEGIIQSSINRGSIGYPHVGYNVGGITGRQSGYLSNCKNYGYIQGRKDVGGISGQLEPYLLLKFSEDTLKRLADEFDNLENLLNGTLDNVDNTSSTLNRDINEVMDLSSLASEDLEQALNATTDFVDQSVEQVNEVSLRVSLFMEGSETALESLSTATEALTDAMDHMSNGFADLKTSTSYASDGIDDLSEAFEDLRLAMVKLHSGLDKISEANTLLINNIGDPVQMAKARTLLEEGFKELEDANEILVRVIPAIIDPLNNLGVDVTAELTNLLHILNGNDTDGIDSDGDGQDADKGAIGKISEGSRIIIDIAADDIETLRQALTIINDGFVMLKDAVFFMEGANKHFSDASKDFAHAATSASSAMSDFEKGSKALSRATSSTQTAIDTMESTIESINDKEDIVFPTLGSGVSEPTDSLFKHLDAINVAVKKLNDNSKGSSDVLTNDFRAINTQVFEIIDIIIQAKERQNMDESERFEDISEKDEALMDEEEQRSKANNVPMDGIHQGYITKSVNHGLVEGDLDAGGIAGAMAIEYDFDPEDDINTKGKESLNFQYQTKAVLKDSLNRGEVVTKKDYAGGIVGRMDLGIVVNGENYGDVKSKTGSYVGGIAGLSAAIIKNSYVKSSIEGKNYVGGITGLGNDIYNSYSMVIIEDASENMGAIAGDVNGICENNYFVNNEFAGIDNISYEAKAVPQNYETFMLAEVLPDEFSRFSLAFRAEGELLGIVSFDYGESIQRDDMPSIPSKEGYYGQWPDIPYDNMTYSLDLEAEYIPLITTIASDDDQGEYAKLLVEGAFDPSARVVYTAIEHPKYAPKFYETPVESWVQTIEDSGKQDAYKVRVKAPEGDDFTLLVRSGDTWKTIALQRDGSYLVFQSQEKNAEYCLVENYLPTIIFIAEIIGVIALIITIVLMLLRRRKKKKMNLPNQ